MGGHPPPPTGDELLKVLAALANPHRLRVIAALTEGRNYVSRLAREIGMSRPLLHMHLQRLEAAGLIRGSLELSSGGKATRYFEVTDFAYTLNPQAVARAAPSLTARSDTAEKADDADGVADQPPNEGTRSRERQPTRTHKRRDNSPRKPGAPEKEDVP